MTDGSTLMGLKGFNNCQFFDHDVAENRSVYLRQCPPDDTCCFTLREHMAVEFWGHQGISNNKHLFLSSLILHNL